MRRVLPLLVLALIAGCASKKVCVPTGQGVVPPPDWRDTVTDQDHEKIRKLREAFLDGLGQARKAGFANRIDGSARLFDPDFAQDGAMPKPGDYRCRTYSLGTKTADRPAFLVGPESPCQVTAAGPIERFVAQDGPQGLTGRIYPDEPSRAVFLGTRMLPDEATPLHYSRDQDRDTVGAIVRLDDRRWRMAIPSPAWGSAIQIVEIVPAG